MKTVKKHKKAKLERPVLKKQTRGVKLHGYEPGVQKAVPKIVGDIQAQGTIDVHYNDYAIRRVLTEHLLNEHTVHVTEEDWDIHQGDDGYHATVKISGIVDPEVLVNGKDVLKKDSDAEESSDEEVDYGDEET